MNGFLIHLSSLHMVAIIDYPGRELERQVRSSWEDAGKPMCFSRFCLLDEAYWKCEVKETEKSRRPAFPLLRCSHTRSPWK